MKGRRLLITIPFLAVIALAIWFWTRAQDATGYFGLPVVSCVDSTESIAQTFAFRLQLTVNGVNVPLGASIGHDPGKCIREIHTDDGSGTVNVRSNSATEQFTLGEFFDVWHKQFTATDFMGHPIGNGHGVSVSVNGTAVTTGAQTFLHPNDVVTVSYD